MPLKEWDGHADLLSSVAAAGCTPCCMIECTLIQYLPTVLLQPRAHAFCKSLYTPLSTRVSIKLKGYISFKKNHSLKKTRGMSI